MVKRTFGDRSKIELLNSNLASKSYAGKSKIKFGQGVTSSENRTGNHRVVRSDPLLTKLTWRGITILEVSDLN